MAQDDIKEVLKRPYRLWTTRLSFKLRKVLRHKSVGKFPSYNSYADAQVSDMAKQIAARAPKQAPAATSPEIAVQAKNPLLALLEGGHADAFMDVVERCLQTSTPIGRTELGAYARLCVEIGQPERLIKTSREFPSTTWAVPRVRLHYFVAKISVGDFREAATFATESLLLGYYDSSMLLRFLGESSLLPDNDLPPVLARVLMRAFHEKLSATEIIYILNLLVASGHAKIAAELSYPDVLKGARVDALLYQSNLALLGGGYDRQLSSINEALTAHGLRPVEVNDAMLPVSVLNLEPSLFRGAFVNGPLVTVAMSTFNSATTVVQALRSLSSQNYRDLEILVIDDQSTDATVEVVEQYSRDFDPRVRVIKQDVNGGTYRCRNKALHEGSGEFFIVNDSDDWAHPERISRLIAELQAKPELVASRSQLLRISATRGIKARPAGYMHDDMSSLMFRREPVLQRAGYYREVSTGADSEFIERLAQIYGPTAISLLKKPLLLADWSPTSLSGSAITGISDGGTMATARQKFRSEFRKQHKNGDLFVPFSGSTSLSK